MWDLRTGAAFKTLPGPCLVDSDRGAIKAPPSRRSQASPSWTRIGLPLITDWRSCCPILFPL